jgi:hypothetical protein
MVWRATCDGCGTERAPIAVRCGLARECPTCRGAELGRRKERIARQVDATERAYERERARHGPTVARPLGVWDWRFVSLTIPPGLGVGRDAKDIGPALRIVSRKLDDWLRTEGNETRGAIVLRAIEATPGETRHGHIHCHALIMAPYIPHALLRRWWGDALATDWRRFIPTRDLEAADDIPHAATRRLVTHTRRGKQGRPIAALPWPVLHVTAADPGSVAELAKYAVKGLEVTDSAAWLDCALALSSVRLYASSRRLARLVDPVKPIERMPCECCGLVGQWKHGTQKQRGPPEGASLVTCRAIIGLA